MGVAAWKQFHPPVYSEPDLIARFSVPGYPARVERAILFRTEAWDWNCPQQTPLALARGRGYREMIAILGRVGAR